MAQNVRQHTAVPAVQNMQQYTAYSNIRKAAAMLSAQNMQQYTAYSDISSALGTEHAAVHSIQ